MYALAIILPLALAAAFTLLVRSWSLGHNILDRTDAAPDRKLQRPPVPLLGGVAVFGAFAVSVLALLLIFPDRLLGGYLLPKHIVGVLAGGVLLMIGGFLDDRRSQKPSRQLLWPALAALSVIAFGIGVTYITNPFGAPFRLDRWAVTLLTLNDLPYRFVVLADTFAFAWLMLTMYTTKFLDGLDGLVSGVSVIGMLIIFFLSSSATVGQPETAILALVGAMSFLGFLFFNLHPAKIFLGEGGSLFAGFLLGTLAILSGGKIATALLILGIPLLDAVWVVGRRFFRRPSSITEADRKHLHYRLLDIGFSHRQAVFILWGCSLVFGGATLLTHGTAKLIVLGLVGLVMLLLAALLTLRSRRMQGLDGDTSGR